MSRRRKPQSRRPATTLATDLVKAHIHKILRTVNAYHAAEAAEIRQLEAAGRRIVGGGGASYSDEDDEGERYSWEITDWHTGEVLAKGDDGEEGYAAAADRLDAAYNLFHIDRVQEDSEFLRTPPTPGVPPGLCEALETWVADSIEAPVEEIAEFLGCDTAEVARCFVTARDR